MTAPTPQTGAERPEKVRPVPVAELVGPAYEPGVRSPENPLLVAPNIVGYRRK
jgi:hypothetical protein